MLDMERLATAVSESVGVTSTATIMPSPSKLRAPRSADPMFSIDDKFST
jgi:hypothetical protein